MLNSGAKPRIVFFGNERIATAINTKTPILQMLVADNYQVVAIVANNNETRSRKIRILEIEDIANEHTIPFYKPEKLNDIRDVLIELRADIGILVAYGKMVPQDIIDIFPHGIVNIHPSLLPKHRGSTPIESVILTGEHETGVALMQIAKEMDAGPVFAVNKLALAGNETKQELADILDILGSKMLQDMLPGILSGELLAQQQDHSEATYDALIQKSDGTLDFTKSAEQLEREVRAFIEWPKSRTIIAGKDVIVTKAHVERSDEYRNAGSPGTVFQHAKQLCVQTSDGVLVIEKLKPTGKSEMDSRAFLSGYAQNL